MLQAQSCKIWLAWNHLSRSLSARSNPQENFWKCQFQSRDASEQRTIVRHKAQTLTPDFVIPFTDPSAWLYVHFFASRGLFEGTYADFDDGELSVCDLNLTCAFGVCSGGRCKLWWRTFSPYPTSKVYRQSQWIQASLGPSVRSKRWLTRSQVSLTSQATRRPCWNQ